MSSRLKHTKSQMLKSYDKNWFPRLVGYVIASSSEIGFHLSRATLSSFGIKMSQLIRVYSLIGDSNIKNNVNCR